MLQCADVAIMFTHFLEEVEKVHKLFLKKSDAVTIFLWSFLGGTNSNSESITSFYTCHIATIQNTLTTT